MSGEIDDAVRQHKNPTACFIVCCFIQSMLSDYLYLHKYVMIAN